MVKRVIAAAAAALLAVGLIAAPAAAADPYIELAFCGPAGGAPWNAFIIAGARNAEGAPTNAAVNIRVAKNGEALTLVATTTPVDGAMFSRTVPIFAPGEPGEARIVLQVSGFTAAECTLVYDPLLETPGVSGVTTVNVGKTSTVLTTVSAYPAASTYITASLQVDRSGAWTTVETVPVIEGRNLALLQYEPTRKEDARIAYHRVGPHFTRFLGVSHTFSFDVRYPSATVTSKPASVVQSKSGAVTVRYGTSTTSGVAVLQRKQGSTWVNPGDAPLADGAATFSIKPTATTTYRAVVTATGEPAKTSPTFTVTYLPAVAVKAPASVKKNANATFTVTHRVTKSGKGTLQVKSGATWKNVKTFTLKASGTSTVSAKVAKTGTYRVKAGSHTSAAVTVKTK